MSNRGEIQRVRKRLENAQRNYDAVMSLPRRRGSQVRWSNGVVWERLGDDSWVAIHPDGTRSTDPEYGEATYPSEHVASFGFELI